MDELKGKLKSLLKPSKKFSGQGHRLGSDDAAVHNKPRPTSAGATSRQPASTRQQQPATGVGSPSHPKQQNGNLQQPYNPPAGVSMTAERELKPATEFSPFTAVIGGGAARTTTNMNPENYRPDSSASNSQATARSPVATPATNMQQQQQQHTALPVQQAPVGADVLEEMQHCLALVASQQHAAVSSMQVLHKLLVNLLSAPQEAKFRQLRLGPNPNAKIAAAVLDVSGALDFLKACGFEEVTVDQPDGQGGTFAYFLDDARLARVEAGLSQLQLALQAAQEAQQPGQQQQPAVPVAPSASATGQRTAASSSTQASRGGSSSNSTAAAAAAAASRVASPAVPRNTLVLLPAAPDVDVPEWFFERTAAEVKAEFMSLLRQRQTKQTFASKAWKDLQLGSSSSSGKKLAVLTLRVRFPEGVCLQGCFGAGEPITAIFEWVTHSLRDPGVTYDLITPSRTALGHTGSVGAADLAGAVLNFRVLSQHKHGYLLDAAGRQHPFLSDELLAQAHAD